MSDKKKKTQVHIWVGQIGTMCGKSHITEGEGFLCLSKMNNTVAIQVNCEKCLRIWKDRRSNERR